MRLFLSTRNLSTPSLHASVCVCLAVSVAIGLVIASGSWLIEVFANVGANEIKATSTRGELEIFAVLRPHADYVPAHEVSGYITFALPGHQSTGRSSWWSASIRREEDVPTEYRFSSHAKSALVAVATLSAVFLCWFLVLRRGMPKQASCSVCGYSLSGLPVVPTGRAHPRQTTFFGRGKRFLRHWWQGIRVAIVVSLLLFIELGVFWFGEVGLVGPWSRGYATGESRRFELRIVDGDIRAPRIYPSKSDDNFVHSAQLQVGALLQHSTREQIARAHVYGPPLMPTIYISCLVAALARVILSDPMLRWIWSLPRTLVWGRLRPLSSGWCKCPECGSTAGA